MAVEPAAVKVVVVVLVVMVVVIASTPVCALSCVPGKVKVICGPACPLSSVSSVLWG